MKKKLLIGTLLALALGLVFFLYAAAAPYSAPPKAESAAEPLFREGCSAKLIESSQEGLDARMFLLAEAQQTLDISYYAVHPGVSSQTVLGGVLAAADRGVQVRLLLDGIFAKLDRDQAEALTSHPNITLKYYNPLDLRHPETINARLHDKYILADDRFLLLGGTNLGDQYMAPAGYIGPISYDREILVQDPTGDLTGDVRAYLDTLWESPWVTLCQPTGKSSARESLLSAAQTYSETHTPWNWQTGMVPTNGIAFLSGPTNQGPKPPVLTQQLANFALNAEHSVVLQSPYVILDDTLQTFLTNLAEKGLDCRILTNSPAASPNPIARSVYTGDRKKIGQLDLRLLEYQGPGSIHAKTWVIDQRLTLLGSFNLDPRSAYIDTELMLAVDSPEFSRQVLAVQEKFMASSLEFGDKTAAPRPMSLGKKLVTRLLALPARAFRYLV